MANLARSFFLPTADQYYTQAEAEGRKIQGYGAAMQNLENHLDQGNKQAIADAITVLARRGQLNGPAMAQVVGMLGQKKMAVMADAQMQADAAREQARQQKALLGDYAKTAAVGDVVKGAAQVGSIALGSWAAGAPLAVAGQAAQKGAMTAGQKLALTGVASALGGNTGYMDMAREQIAGPSKDAALQRQEGINSILYKRLYGFDPVQEYLDSLKPKVPATSRPSGMLGDRSGDYPF